jgi:ABC-2 type transport system ATP-binding protein
MDILAIKNVVKNYDKHVAVNDVSLTVPKGSIFGLLGPNGAGKTSLIRMITTITRPDSGSILFAGEPLGEQHPERIGYMPEERGLYKKMKVGEQLLYLAQLKGMSEKDAEKRLKMWFEKFEIQSWWDKKVEELSKGMQQKAQFIATVLHEPELLILDEPFSGLDPLNANLIKDEIYEMQQRGVSIIFSTHRMEQVEEICNHIVLINKGKNVLEGNVQEVRNRFKENLFRVEFVGELPENLANIATITAQKNREVTLRLHENVASNTILTTFLQNNCIIISFQEILPTLNEIFIKQVQ